MSPGLPKVLVIDDDLDQLQILSVALEKKYEVLTASDGLDGYVIACREQPAAVVLDVMMPIVDGWTVLRKMRANPLTKDMRIVVATAVDGDTVMAEASKLNVSRVLRKPIDLKQLLDAVAQLTGD